MRVIRCPHCGVPLPWTAQACAKCGRNVPVQAQFPHDADATITIKKTARRRPPSLRTHSFYQMGQDDPDETQRIIRSQVQAENVGTRFIASTSPIGRTTGRPRIVEDWPEEMEGDDERQRRTTWQKFVTRKTQAVSIAVPMSLPATPIPDPPIMSVTPVTPPFERAVSAEPVYKNRPPRFPMISHFTGWVTILVIVALLLGGGFGVLVSLGRNTQPVVPTGPFSLQVSPSSIAFGGVITLRAAHFTPRGRVGLTRDATIPLVDTNGASLISADAHGSFSDTVSIDGTWTAGTHIIRAEDAHSHKTASFNILVSGHSASLRPAHLMLSVGSVDLGSGDQAMNGTQVIMLANAGGGVINWQSTVTQPWLLLSPKSGTFASGQQMKITLAGDRVGLQVGAYKAAVIFSSSAGQIALPIKMQVTQLRPGHEAVLQVTPAVLSFSAGDGGANPTSQVVTISNPGLLPLQWKASSTTNDGSNWLAISSQSGTLAKGNSLPVSIEVNSGLLLPGVYYGSVTFSNQGAQAVMNSPQTIYVSVTITPQCSIQVSPGTLAFAAVYLQSAPGAKNISVGVNQGCSAPLKWSVTATTNNGGHWLTVNASNGTTPSSPQVGIIPGKLTPGNYSGALIFSSPAGTQTLPVTLAMGQPTTPILSSAPALLAVNGIVGQTQPSIQTLVLTNAGGGTLAWSAAATTTVGGAWLSAIPPSGVLGSHQSANITVTVTVLSSLIPGSYSGSITLSGTDGNGHAAAGSPQTLPVTFTVQAPCSLSTPVPALNFQSVVGQPAPPAQRIAINATGACAHALSWSAVPAGGAWLTLSSASGTVSTATSSSTMVAIANAGLPANTYTGSVTIKAVDSVTHAAVGGPQVVTITLVVQPLCALQAPSATSEAFSSEVGRNPVAQTQSFTVGVIGACAGSVTITPNAIMNSGSGWLAVTPTSATISSGATATFTVTVTSSALAGGSYTGAISLAAVNGSAVIAGSPQSVAVTLGVVSPPTLGISTSSLQFNVSTGVSSQTVTITNTGGEPLNWSAALTSSSPAFVTIASATSGNLLAGASTTITISVDATGQTGGSTFLAGVTISATDPLTNATVSGSPATVGITITITPPAMQLSTTTMTFAAPANTNPDAQTLTISNTGGNTLAWTAGTPSQSWLSASSTTGSDTAGGTSTSTFTVNDAGMVAGTYTATVNFTAPGGISQVVTITLTLS